MSKITKAISSDGFVACSVINSKDMVEAARLFHNTSPVVTAALGRTLSATSLIGSTLKIDGASVTVRIDGGGPVGTILVVSDEEGNVRGYVSNPQADLPKRLDGKLNVGGIVGIDGTITVIKDTGSKEPYIGSTGLVSGEIAEDFAAYFAASEQVPTACAFGVLVDTDRSVLAAGGYIVSLLPGAPNEAIDLMEENVKNTGYVTDILKETNEITLLDSIMKGFNHKIIEEKEVFYKCTCSRERFLNAVLSLDDSELRDMWEKSEPIEVCCQFCDKKYTFDVDELVRD